MYRQTVVRLNRDKYKKASDTLLELVLGEKLLYASFNSAYYICKTCDCALSGGSTPIQSVANNLEQLCKQRRGFVASFPGFLFSCLVTL